MSVSPRTHEKTLSAGAFRLLAFFRSKGATAAGCWWFQSNIAAALEVSPRTVRRQLTELVGAGLIDSKRRGSTSNLYALRGASNVLSDRPNLAYRGRGIFITESKTPKKAALAEFPPEEIQHPRVQAALRRGRSRIERADNPEAYAAAIIRAELSAAQMPRPALSRTSDSAPTRDVARETATSPDLDGLEEFIREHERKAGDAKCINATTAAASTLDSVRTLDRIAPVTAPHTGTREQEAVCDVQPMPRSGVLRRPCGRSLRRAVALVQLPGFLRGAEQHARSG